MARRLAFFVPFCSFAVPLLLLGGLFLLRFLGRRLFRWVFRSFFRSFLRAITCLGFLRRQALIPLFTRVIGHVPPRSLELDRWRTDQPFYSPPAMRAFLQMRPGSALNFLRP